MRTFSSGLKYGSLRNDSTDITKYNESDIKTVLEPEDDAACVNWGGGCRMPTVFEFSELNNSDNCTWTWTSRIASNGSTIDGYEVKSKKNGNSIFLPASGVRSGDNLYDHGSYGFYWSSTLSTDDISDAYILFFYRGRRNVDSDYCYRCCGISVRPVAEP